MPKVLFSPLNPSKKDRRITIRYKTWTTNDYGERVESWENGDTVWAERVELRGAEGWSAKQTVGMLSCKYKIQYRTGISELNRVIDSGVEYGIESVLEIGRKQGLELICRKVIN